MQAAAGPLLEQHRHFFGDEYFPFLSPICQRVNLTVSSTVRPSVCLSDRGQALSRRGPSIHPSRNLG
eukprot:scaffold303436_cov13-Prasinocladus_malaysianus.AAC.1